MDANALSFERFRRELYEEYLAWFADPELNRRLGPMDDEWLTAVLAETDEQGNTWAVFVASEMVGVIETVFYPAWPCTIAAIAVKPTRRHEGLGRAMLQRLLADYGAKGIESYMAYIEHTNEVASRLFRGEGFQAIAGPNDKGYVEFRRP